MVLKCKMCGGDLVIQDGQTIVKCEYCGNTNTIPKTLDENTQELFNRANALRIRCEFDLSEKLYDKIIEENGKESEAYWGKLLCQYGIEYVDDPKTGKRIPTCHRTSFEALSADFNYKQAIKYADAVQKPVYQEEARVIDNIQKEILAICNKEEPYDVFICYKETDSNGVRTQDSVIANDIYYQLTQEGYKVFYAAITLEDKLGQDYEPIIFAALNSAKVMLAIGTKPDYFKAVWVKNEWSRFLKMMKKDRKKQLFPCYKDMDPYELPEEFAHLQAQDMGKIGFINDIVRGIKKIVIKEQPKEETVKGVKEEETESPLIKRAFLFLEDRNWEDANTYLEKALDQNPENAMAYVGKLMIDLKVNKVDALGLQDNSFNLNANYNKAYRFADKKLKNKLDGYLDDIQNRQENQRKEVLYNAAVTLLSSSNTVSDYNNAKNKFSELGNYKDSAQKAKLCYEKAEAIRKNAIYSNALELVNSKDETKIKEAKPLFESIIDWKDSKEFLAKIPELCVIARKEKVYYSAISKFNTNDIAKIKLASEEFKTIIDWKDSKSKIQQCLSKIEQLEIKAKKEKELAEQLAREKEAARIRRNKAIKKASIISAVLAIILTVALILTFTMFIPNSKISQADELFNAGKYEEAIRIYGDLGTYKNAQNKIGVVEAVKEIQQESSSNYNTSIEKMLDNGAIVTVKYAFEGGEFGEEDESSKITAFSYVAEQHDDVSQDTFVYRSKAEFNGLKTPVRNGYRFTGWSLVECKPSISSELSNVSIEFKANWQIKAYSIGYKLNGGIVSKANPIGYDVEDDTFTLMNPTKAGYTFIGWSGTGLDGLTIETVIEKGSYGNRSYTANWMVNTYNVTFDENGGTDVENKTATFDSNFTMPEISRVGYAFGGWYSGSVKYTDGIWKTAGDVTLKAKWNILTYNISYNLNGGNATNKTTFTVEDAFTLNNPTRTGYTFTGWSGTGIDGTSISVTVAKGSVNNRSYKANWTVNTYNVTFDENGGTDVEDKTATFDSNFTMPEISRVGYAFGGWYSGSVKYTDGIWKTAGDVTLKAKWNILTYNISYNLNDGNATNKTTFTVEDTFTLNNPTRIGYTFDGWTKDEETVKVMTVTIDHEIGSRLYTANWTANINTLHFDANGGTGEMADIQIATYEMITLPANEFTRTGYKFIGWSRTADGEAMCSDKASYTMGRYPEYTLYAVWQIRTYTITYTLNGGENHPDNPATYTVEDTITLKDPSKTGYTFTGWDNDIVIPQGSTGDKTFTASWTVHSYKVRFYANGGNGNMSDQYFAYDETKNLTANKLTKTGYEFKGWAMSPAGEKVYNDGESVKNLTATDNGVIRLYAVWEIISYTITYNLNGGTNNAENPATYTIESSTITLKDPTKTRYAFSGWTKDGNPVTEIVKGSMGDIILTASWYSSGLSYQKNDGDNSYTVTGIGTFKYTDLIIPSTYNGKAVTTIEINAFSNCKSLTSVTIPDSVTSIGSSAFSGCSSLQEITIPFVGAKAGVTSSSTYQYPFGYIFGTSSYTGGTATTQYYYGSSTSSTTNTTYYIPSSLRKVTVKGGNILYGAFRDCTSLTSVTIGNSVTSIGNQAFFGCTSLTSITIPDSVTSIGGHAFYECSSLTSVTIGSGVTSIGEAAFLYCTKLTSINVSEDNTAYKDIDGNLYSKDGKTLIKYARAKTATEFDIPNGVTSIRGSAFYNCTSLTSVTIPDSVTSIGNYAFWGCTSLTSVTIPDSVTSIGNSAFSYCTSLSEVTIGDSVTSIGDGAFYGCTSLTSVTIGDSVTSIGRGAFMGCASLTSVTFKNTSGWKVSESSYMSNATSLSSSNLSNNAANYLTSKYLYYYWERG